MTPPKLRYAAIADDLTGATDVAAAFIRAGFTAAAAITSPPPRSLEVDVIVVSTDSRQDSGVVAQSKVVRAFTHLRRQGYLVCYKKMDSTVQGNIVAEVQALRDAAGLPCALVCPANPEQGRRVRNGVLWVRGRKLADLSELFARQGLGEHATAALPLTPSKVRRALRSVPFVIADAVSWGDLLTLARVGTSEGALLAGSAGMAAALAHVLGGRLGHTPRKGELALGRGQFKRSVLVLCGSSNPVTTRQLQNIAARFGSRSMHLTSQTARALALEIDYKRPAIVQLPIHVVPEEALLRDLDRLSDLFRRGRVGALLLTGGDTARLVCGWLGARAIALEGEVVPGLPWGALIGGMADRTLVCTKPGGFGESDSLSRAASFLGTHSATRPTSASPEK
jgi:D-threonate/D-erythronate kinase